MPSPAWISFKNILTCKLDRHGYGVHEPSKTFKPKEGSSPPPGTPSRRERRKRMKRPMPCCKDNSAEPPKVAGRGISLSSSSRGGGGRRVMHLPSPLADGSANPYLSPRTPPPAALSSSSTGSLLSPSMLLSSSSMSLSSGRLSFSVTGSGSPSSRSLVQLTRLSGCYNIECATPTPCCADGNLVVIGGGGGGGGGNLMSSCGGYANGVSSQTTCPGCGSHFRKRQAFDDHYCPHHTVTELKDGDSARKIVEIIFQTSWLNKDTPHGTIERILKVNNSPQAIAAFEEYRNTIKAKAARLPKKHPRCAADGNELLRFHCTSIACNLGGKVSASASTSLCNLPCCHTCNILRSGFAPASNRGHGQQEGIYTTASSGKAHDSSMEYVPEVVVGVPSPLREQKKAMIVCRVIAGRVKKLFQEESHQEGEQSEHDHIGYDSVAGAAGPYTNLDELLVFNPTAVLPCFVIIYGGG